ncbi:LytTR family DNA-binding domain-containing protein [Niabella hibiscisoli]|uniref:LytTR family DNA-binding domain-containing protein n=1 Tax=Niabella hibiscisoli TaxID=1825928 RepID=UPI001F1033B5|nr:LytTR family DNA-binding domain-containing protein [Niabella hibiscisoli]MCH5720005.1 LytTR family transcriptional regulator [Niabella hibiscisoli]
MTSSIKIPAGSREKMLFLFLPVVLLLVSANIASDYLYTLFQQTAFYLSESALFSSYWLLFLPLLLLQRRCMSPTQSWHWQFIVTLLVIAVHLLTYPALIGLLSALFYDHTFAYGQSFQFGLSAYLVQSLVIYGYGVAAIFMQKKIAPPPANADIIKINTIAEPSASLQNVLVVEGSNTQTLVAVNDIHYFSASPPYVTIHLSHKKYLYTATLKSLEAELDGDVFVRVHRSCLLNINKVSSIRSRKNGDYDVTLINETVLRVSRNYAQPFKQLWLMRTPLAVK